MALTLCHQPNVHLLMSFLEGLCCSSANRIVKSFVFENVINLDSLALSPFSVTELSSSTQIKGDMHRGQEHTREGAICGEMGF